MITKEKSPMRVLFFRDHEISGFGPPGADPLTVGVRAAGRPGLVVLAGRTETELVKPDRELGDKSRQDGRLRSMIQQPSVNCRSQP